MLCLNSCIFTKSCDCKKDDRRIRKEWRKQQKNKKYQKQRFGELHKIIPLKYS
jgi:hypothetical protein